MVCECGTPALLLMNRQTGLLKMASNLDFFLADVEGKLSQYPITMA